MDPFLDLIQLLRPRATLWGRIDGFGQWGVSFRKRDDLLFCWMERGKCHLVRPFLPTVQLQPDDFVLIRSSTPFSLTSDPTIEPVDSETLVMATGDTAMKLGEGTDSGSKMPRPPARSTTPMNRKKSFDTCPVHGKVCEFLAIGISR
jgi:Cupin